MPETIMLNEGSGGTTIQATPDGMLMVCLCEEATRYVYDPSGRGWHLCDKHGALPLRLLGLSSLVHVKNEDGNIVPLTTDMLKG